MHIKCVLHLSLWITTLVPTRTPRTPRTPPPNNKLLITDAWNEQRLEASWYPDIPRFETSVLLVPTVVYTDPFYPGKNHAYPPPIIDIILLNIQLPPIIPNYSTSTDNFHRLQALTIQKASQCKPTKLRLPKALAELLRACDSSTLLGALTGPISTSNVHFNHATCST